MSLMNSDDTSENCFLPMANSGGASLKPFLLDDLLWANENFATFFELLS